MKRHGACLAVLLVFLAAPVFARPILDADHGLPGGTAELEALHQELVRHQRAGDHSSGIPVAEELVARLGAAHGEASAFQAQPLLHLGLWRLDLGELEAAHMNLSRAVGLLEADGGQYDLRLVGPLRGLAAVQEAVGDFDGAAKSLTRAQVVIHRHQGVYSPDQLPVIDSLIRLLENNGKKSEIDQQEQLYLRIHEEAYGTDDPRIVPALLRLGEHFARRSARDPWTSSSRPMTMARSLRAVESMEFLNESTASYERAVAIVSEHHGDASIEMIGPLRGIASQKRLRRLGKEEGAVALARVTRLLKAHAGSDVADVVRSIVDLGDFYTILGDPRAKKAYREAWHAIPEGETYRELREELFGAPRLLEPQDLQIRIHRRPWHDQAGVYTDFEYIVRYDGRAARFKVIDSNASQKSTSLLRRKLYRSRFRPRVVDGEVVTTENLVAHQDYRYYE